MIVFIKMKTVLYIMKDLSIPNSLTYIRVHFHLSLPEFPHLGSVKGIHF